MNNPKQRYLGIFTVLCISLYCVQEMYGHPSPSPPFLQVDHTWADTTLAAMSLDEKLGQLFIISAANPSCSGLLKLQEETHAGGILLSNLTLDSYITYINRLRQLKTIPLLELSDQSISVNNQFSNLDNFPSPSTFSAIDNEPLKNALYEKMLKDYSTLGINCSIAPSIHYAKNACEAYSPLNNEANPAQVFNRAGRQVNQLSNRKILPIVQGISLPNDSIPDSLLVKNGYYEQYSAITNKGLAGVYMDQQIFEGESSRYRRPEFFKKYLAEKLDFNGVIIANLSDKAAFIDCYYAGADAYIVDEKEINQTIAQLKNLIATKVIKLATIEDKVRKLLLAKSWLGLAQTEPELLERSKVTSSIFSPSELYLQEIYDQSIILGNNQAAILPLATTYGKRRTIVHVGEQKLNTLQNTAFQYVNCSSHLYRPKEDGALNALAFDGTEEQYIIALDHIVLSVEQHKKFIASINKLSLDNEVVLVNFGNPYNLNLFDKQVASVQLFDKNKMTEKLAMQLLFGGKTATGKLPITLPGFEVVKQPYAKGRLNHALPEQVGMDSYKLSKIDEIVERAIRSRAMPGCQVLVAKNGSIVYSKGFGYHTYDKKQRVERSDIYDLASITKVAATTIGMMQLYENKMASLDQAIGTQMPLPAHSSIKNIPLTNLLIHKSGLQKNMPISTFLNNRKGTDCTTYFCNKQSENFSVKITDQLYFNANYQDKIWSKVNRLERPNKYKYRSFLYGDVNFYILQQFIEAKTKKALDVYINEKFYEPLGLRYCLFNPLRRLPKSMIPPTQQDLKWRNSLVEGMVHDETAALHGGVGGNAGLFSNAEDLAVLFQMLLNGGTYGGQQYLEPETIELFTKAGHGNHRGLGFDKPGQNYTIARSASMSSYGHSGFTGTCVWVDPESDLIYIFLSNRIHPSGSNLLNKLGIRRKVHQAIYDAIEKDVKAEETLFVNLDGAE